VYARYQESVSGNGDYVMDRLIMILDPDTVVVSSGEVEDLRARMQDALRGIEDKTTHLVFKDLRRLLFRCSALLISKEEVSFEGHRQNIYSSH
jgi:predicted NBD/HSP70 family sugar kinase